VQWSNFCTIRHCAALSILCSGSGGLEMEGCGGHMVARGRFELPSTGPKPVTDRVFS